VNYRLSSRILFCSCLFRTFAWRHAVLRFLLIIPSPSRQISKFFFFFFFFFLKKKKKKKNKQTTICGVDKALAIAQRRRRYESRKPLKEYRIRKVFVGSLRPDSFLLT